jgi:DNA modification methylase
MAPYYDDGQIQIWHGDCREILPDIHGAYQAVVTDPPYGIGWSRGVNSARNSKSHDGIANDEDTSVRDDALDMVSGVPAVVFGSFYAPFPSRLKQVLVWEKPADSGVVGSTTGFRRNVEPVFIVGPWPHQSVKWSSLLKPCAGSISAVATETGHPHTKPVGLMRILIERCPDGVILDPFMGSGTTLRAAKDLGRKAIGIEIEERYCEIAAKRLQQSVMVLT